MTNKPKAMGKDAQPETPKEPSLQELTLAAQKVRDAAAAFNASVVEAQKLDISTQVVVNQLPVHGTASVHTIQAMTFCMLAQPKPKAPETSAPAASGKELGQGIKKKDAADAEKKSDDNSDAAA